MSSTTPALIAAAAGVGFGHAVLPDHWLPLAVLGRTRRYPLGRVARLSGIAGVGHVVTSLLLGAVIIAIGLQFRSSIEHAQDTIVGCLLIATGVGFLALALTGHGHGHDQHEDHRHEHAEARRLGPLGVMVPFGAAASPDLTILPVFLAAAAVGAGTAVFSLVAFAAATILTMVALTLIATFGGYQLTGRWLDRWGNVITAVTLVVIGALIVSGVI